MAGNLIKYVTTDYHGVTHPALVYGRVFARAGYVTTRKRWAQADRKNTQNYILNFFRVHPCASSVANMDLIMVPAYTD
jgi:hypothetical protein